MCSLSLKSRCYQVFVNRCLRFVFINVRPFLDIVWFFLVVYRGVQATEIDAHRLSLNGELRVHVERPIYSIASFVAAQQHKIIGLCEVLFLKSVLDDRLWLRFFPGLGFIDIAEQIFPFIGLTEDEIDLSIFQVICDLCFLDHDWPWFSSANRCLVRIEVIR